MIDVPGLDDIAIHNLSELEYYKAGEPAVGSICRVVRLPYYMIFFTILAYDYPACSAPATGAE